MGWERRGRCIGVGAGAVGAEGWVQTAGGGWWVQRGGFRGVGGKNVFSEKTNNFQKSK